MNDFLWGVLTVLAAEFILVMGALRILKKDEDYVKEHKNDPKFGRYAGIILVFLLAGCSLEYRVQTKVNGYNDTIYVVQDWTPCHWEDCLWVTGQFRSKSEADSAMAAQIAKDTHERLSEYH